MPQPSGVPLCSGPVGSGGQYTACVSSGNCADIYECVSTGSYEWCMQWCSSDLDCPAYPADLCYALNPAVYVGGQQWGVCWDGYP